MKKPTLKIMNDYCKAHEVESVTLQLAEDCELKVTPSLSLAERLTFINRVVDFCVSDTGEELPEYFDLIFWTTVFQMMSNMSLPKVKGEESVDLTVMQKWIDAMPREFHDKLLYANNDYLCSVRVDCLNKIDARCKYATSLVGSLHYANDQAEGFMDKMQQMEDINAEFIAQADAAKKLADVYKDNVVDLPVGEVDE